MPPSGAAGPGRRRAVRVSLLLVVVPTFASIAWHGGLRRWLDPSIEEYERKQAEKLAMEDRLRTSTALAIDRDAEGLRISNLSGETLQLQVAFLKRRHEQGLRVRRLRRLGVERERRAGLSQRERVSVLAPGEILDKSVAVAHGNRTHRTCLSARATGFEDRAGHQIRTRYRRGK